MLNDSEKVALLIELLDLHMKKLSNEGNVTNYLENILGFLKAKDPGLQKAAISNSELYIDDLSCDLRFTSKQAVGSLIAAFDKVGYAESMDAADVILNFEEFLKLSKEETEKIFRERWMIV